MRFDAPTGSTYETLMTGAERRVISGTLERCEGSEGDAAAALGVPLKFLIARSRKLGLRRKRSTPTAPASDEQRARLAAGRALRWAAKKEQTT